MVTDFVACPDPPELLFRIPDLFSRKPSLRRRHESARGRGRRASSARTTTLMQLRESNLVLNGSDLQVGLEPFDVSFKDFRQESSTQDT